MIDTIKLKLNRLVVKDSAELKINNFPEELSNTFPNIGYNLFSTESGNKYYGKSKS